MIKIYKCSICGVTFETEKECEEHEKIHSTCRCQGGKNPEKYFAYQRLGYGEDVSVSVDFKIPAIVKYYERDNSSGHYINREEIKIKYCPFCGRKLRGADNG